MSFADGVSETIRRATCLVLGQAKVRTEVLRYVLEPSGLDYPESPGEALYGMFCGLPVPPQEEVVPPFSGGQCPGIVYRIRYFYKTYNLDGSVSGQGYDQNSTITGPVGGVTVRASAGGDYWYSVIKGGSSEIEGVLSGRLTGQGEIIPKPEAYLVSATREDGQPDNCGNFPGAGNFQPGDNAVNDTVTYTTNNNTTINAPVEINFGYAFEAPDLSLQIPVSLTFNNSPSLDFNGTLNFSTGELSIPLAGAGKNPTKCTPGKDAYKPGDNLPEPPGTIPDEPQPPVQPGKNPQKNRVLKGAIITTTVLDGNETILYQGNNPDIYIPALGYVQFLIEVGGRTAWSNDIPIKCLRSFIPCPWEAGATDVRGTPRFGNQFIVTPVYVAETINPTFPPAP